LREWTPGKRTGIEVMSGVAALIERMRLLPFPWRLEAFTRREAIVSRCAGLDVHTRVIVATVRLEQAEGAVSQETRTCSRFRRDREALCRWLQEGEVE
jgi:hypothetical protein